MLFNSAVFIILFFITYALYWHLDNRWKQNLIIAGSLAFYGWYSISFLLVFVALIIVNYYISMILIERKSRSLLWLAIALDAGLLGFFKYFYLFAESAGWLIGNHYLAHLETNWLRDYDFHIDLPIAISFYTFQIIAFVVDSYRGVITEKIAPKKFYLFILFFPQFVAGPIMRSTDFLPQIDRPKLNDDNILNGSLLLIQGIIKKVLIADHLGGYTAPLWASPEKYDAIFLILILPSFIVQIYFDFSGYTDMARGLAKALGYDIPENFKGPFLARSMAELWQRWHVTLSTWLRDYIYIPLGGSRLGEFRTSLNLLLTMAIGGLWHGANWNMLLWGVFVGTILVAERLLKKAGIRILPATTLLDPLRIFVVFALFSISGLFFRASDMDTVYKIVYGIFTFQRGLPGPGPATLIGFIFLAYLFNAMQYYPDWSTRFTRGNAIRYGFISFMTFITGYLVSLYGDVSGSFIYFQF